MLNTLAEALEKRGPNLLDEEVVITEKIDTFRLIFEKKGEDIIFYSKDNKKIDLVTRTLTDIWEQAVLEIPIITKNASIPEGLFFGLYYTPVERPIRIPYSKIPRYILTDVTKRKNGKVVEACNYSEVSQWAAELCMGRPPVLFEGKLSDEQKKLLIAYDTKQYDGEQLTFAKMIEENFHTSYSQEDIIEGIIIKSGDKLTQIISYEFELLNEAYEKANESRDFYDIIISDLTEYLENYNIPMLEAENKDQLYINMVCSIFNDYCKDRTVNENMDASYLHSPQFGYGGKLNKQLIENKETLEWINSAPIYESLFRVFLSSFRKPKKPYGLLTESIVNRFNNHISLINGYINNFEINESEEYEGACRCLTLGYVDNGDGTTTCSTCRRSWDHEKYGAKGKQKITEARSDNVVVDAFKKRNPTDVDNMRVIASIQKAFEPRIEDVNQGTKPCAVYVTTFRPFTASQWNNVERISQMWNAPVILAAVSNKYRVDGNKFHPSDELVKAQMRALTLANPQIAPGHIQLDSWNLTEIFQYTRPHYEPMVIITDTGKKSEFTLQLFFEEEIMGGRINVDSKFNIGEMENEDAITIVRAIEDNNYALFMELTPQPIHNVFNMIFEEYRLWAGKIIKPING